MPLFDAGRNRANLAQVRAARETALAQYEKGIQTAFREVADALAARSLLAEQRGAQLAQLSAERRRVTLAQARFDAGVASSLDLLDAQRSAFAAEQALVQTQSVQAQNLVGLWRALAVTRAMAPSAEPGDQIRPANQASAAAACASTSANQAAPPSSASKRCGRLVSCRGLVQ